MSLFRVISGLISDTEARRARVDASTHALEFIDYEHHEIHSGSHFFYTDAISLGVGGSQDYVLTTPNTTKWAHFIWEISHLAVTAVTLYEGTDRAGNTLQTTFNSNRNSATTPTMTIHKGTVGGSTDGTAIYTYSFGMATGASTRIGGASRSMEEIVLAQNTKYILRVASSTASNLISVRLVWYEHTDRN